MQDTIFFNEDPPLNEQGESILCEMNKFDMMALLAEKSPKFAEVLAVDADLNLFQRAWCVAELDEAHPLGMAQKPFPKEQGHLNDTAIHFATGGEYEGPEDVQQILSKLPNKMAFNQKLHELMFDGNVGLLAAWKKADVLQQMEDLSHVLKWGVSASVSTMAHSFGAAGLHLRDNADDLKRADFGLNRTMITKVFAVSPLACSFICSNIIQYLGGPAPNFLESNNQVGIFGV